MTVSYKVVGAWMVTTTAVVLLGWETLGGPQIAGRWGMVTAAAAVVCWMEARMCAHARRLGEVIRQRHDHDAIVEQIPTRR